MNFTILHVRNNCAFKTVKLNLFFSFYPSNVYLSLLLTQLVIFDSVTSLESQANNKENQTSHYDKENHVFVYTDFVFELIFHFFLQKRENSRQTEKKINRITDLKVEGEKKSIKQR